MQNIISIEGSDNIGNILQLRFIPIIDVESIPAPAGFAISTAVVPKATKDWYIAKYTEQTCSYSEESVESANGPYNRFSISFFVPKVSKLMSKNFNEMRDHRFLIDVYDMNQDRKLVGTLKEGVAFKYVLSPGKGGESNGYICSFYSEAIHIYNYEDLDSIPEGGGGSGGA